MTDATDDLDLELSGERARFRKADKELWERQKAELRLKQLEKAKKPTPEKKEL